MKKNIHIFCLAALFAITLCAGKCNKDTMPTEDQLPPVTQTGANTFGCLVNGKVYIPKGYNGNGTPNPNKIFDIGLNGLPYLGMKGQQIAKDNTVEGEIIVSFRNIRGVGFYNYPNDFYFSVSWNKWITNCPINTYDTTFRQGGGAITNYDLTNGIVSGTFNFKYKTPNCDTVYITDGRFDFKL